MCGRFTLTVELSDIQQDLGIKVDDVMIDWSPSYNISPTQTVLTVNQLGERKIKPMRWGLIPSWAKDESIGSKMINARSETLHEKPSFRKSLLSRRCLILADGFYEWKSNPGGSKIPYYFQIADHSLFLFAGLWDTWQPKKGMPIESCTVITCEANSCVSPVHPRMPVILSREAGWKWLDVPSGFDPASLLKPYPAEKMITYPVNRWVNDPKNNRDDLISPVDQ